MLLLEVAVAVHAGCVLEVRGKSVLDLGSHFVYEQCI